MSASSERRWKLVRLPHRFIMDILDICAGASVDRFTIPVIQGLPEGYEVVDVDHDFYIKAFCVRVAHPSFPQVPDGAMTPYLCDDMDRKVAHLRMEEWLKVSPLKMMPVDPPRADGATGPSMECCGYDADKPAIRGREFL